MARLDGGPAGRDDLRRPDSPVPADPGDPGARPRQVVRRRRGDLARRARRRRPPARAAARARPRDGHDREIPIEGLSHLHMDPEEPVPGAGDGGMLERGRRRADRSFVRAGRWDADPRAPRSATSVEPWRGARPSTVRSTSFDAPYLMFAVGLDPDAGVGGGGGDASWPTSGRRWSPGRQTTRT